LDTTGFKPGNSDIFLPKIKLSYGILKTENSECIKMNDYLKIPLK